MKKPDRFARMVERMVNKRTPWTGDIWCVDVVRMLESEHRAVGRMVTRVLNEPVNDTEHTRRLKTRLLDALVRRAR